MNTEDQAKAPGRDRSPAAPRARGLRRVVPDQLAQRPLMSRLPGWRTRAACRGRVDLDFIDPRTPAEAEQCRAICAGCPVLDQCRAEALTAGEAWGIWGGLDADERTQLAERHGHPQPMVRPAHGTNPRYAKHGCRCTPCRSAHTEYERRRRERARHQAAGRPRQPPVVAEPRSNGDSSACAGGFVRPSASRPPREEATCSDPYADRLADGHTPTSAA